MHERVSRLLPPSPLGRALAFRSGLYAVGTGGFIAGNAVFFTQIVGLSPSLVGLGISLAGVVFFRTLSRTASPCPHEQRPCHRCRPGWWPFV